MAIQYSSTKDFTPEQLAGLFNKLGWLSGLYPERLAKAVAGSKTVFSAWDGETLVGLATAMDDGELNAYVHYLLVDPALQRQGIGRTLLGKMKETYKDYLYIFLVSETDSVLDFYEKLGFQKIPGSYPVGRLNRF